MFKMVRTHLGTKLSTLDGTLAIDLVRSANDNFARMTKAHKTKAAKVAKAAAR